MVSDEDLSGLARRVTPDRLEEYLTARGWRRVDAPSQQHLALYRSESSQSKEIAVPLEPRFSDYLLRVEEAIDSIAGAETRSRLDVFRSLLRFGSMGDSSGLAPATWLLGIGSTMFTLGLNWIVAWVTWTGIMLKLDGIPTDGPNPHWSLYSSIALTLVGGVVMTFGVHRFLRDESDVLVQNDIEAVSRYQYGRYLVGIGFALILDASITLVALSGLAYNGILGELFKATPKEPTSHIEEFIMHLRPAVLVLTSAGMALLGALFFTANSLRTKRDSDEPFSNSRFWGGLWFRLGEAVLFSLVMLFLAYPEQESGGHLQWLPLVSLLLGMFVTSGERLVFGIAQRMFAAVEGLVPGALDRSGPSPVAKGASAHGSKSAEPAAAAGGRTP